MTNTDLSRVLQRGMFIYYVGSVVFVVGAALLALGIASVMFFRLHHGSSPESISFFFVFSGVGTIMILAGINLMMKQTRYGYHIVGGSAISSALSLIIFIANYPHNWHYPLISYALALYVIGFMALLGNAFANVILWVIESKPKALAADGMAGVREYTDEEIERDIEEAIRKSIEVASSELTFKEPRGESVKLGKAFRESRGDTVRIKDDVQEAKSLSRAKQPGGRIKSGSTEVEVTAKNLERVFREGGVDKGLLEEVEGKVKGGAEKLYAAIKGVKK